MNGFGNMKDWITARLKGRNKTDGVVLILIGILILIILIPTGSSKKSTARETAGSNESTNLKQDGMLSSVMTDEEYVRNLEQQLQKLFEHMDGVGKASVMLTLADNGLAQLDKDVKTQEKSREETTVVYDSGDKSEPYVVRRMRPKVEGVVVVAQGGNDPGVITEISDALQSLFDLEAHKVKVVKMSVQEE